MDRSLDPTSISLHVLGLRAHVACGDPAATDALLAAFGALLGPEPAEPDLRYRIERAGRAPSYALRRDGGTSERCDDLDDLVYALDKDLTIELQRRRRELFFLHAAALEWRGRAFLLAAASGCGKSTTAWALVHHGFGYLSDELAPIDLRAMAVLPYPHALCLKRDPPPPHALPPGALRLGTRIHVPTEALAGTTCVEPRPLAAVFLVAFRTGLAAPRFRALGRPEASARLYATALNALAHPNSGLDAAVRIAEHVPCFAVDTAALQPTAEMVRALAGQVIGSRAEAA